MKDRFLLALFWLANAPALLAPIHWFIKVILIVIAAVGSSLYCINQYQTFAQNNKTIYIVVVVNRVFYSLFKRKSAGRDKDKYRGSGKK